MTLHTPMSAAAYLAAAKLALPPYPEKKRGSKKLWRPPPSSPLTESLGAPGDRSPVVARATSTTRRYEIQGTTPEPRMPVAVARETVQRFMAYIAKTEAAERQAAAATGKPMSQPILSGTWTIIQASPKTNIALWPSATNEKANTALREALWRAFLVDLEAKSGARRRALFRDPGMLYWVVEKFRGTRVRTMRNNHMVFKKPRPSVAARIAKDLADFEAAQSARQPAASPLAPPAASPAAPRVADPAGPPAAPSAVPAISQPTASAPVESRKPLTPLNGRKRTRGDGDDVAAHPAKRPWTEARQERSTPKPQGANSNISDGRRVQSPNNTKSTPGAHASSGGKSAELPPASDTDQMECDPPSNNGDEVLAV